MWEVGLRTDLRLTLSSSTELEMCVMCAVITEQYLLLSQHARSLLSPLTVLAFPTNAKLMGRDVARYKNQRHECEIRVEPKEKSSVFGIFTCSPEGPGPPLKPLSPSSPFAPLRPCIPRGPGSPSTP